MSTDTTASELLPCPFCGSEARLYPRSRGHRAFVECTRSDCETGNPDFADVVDPEHDSAREAVACWNRRAARAESPQAAAEPPAPASPEGALTDEQIDAALFAINNAAMDCDPCAFGLPLESRKAELRQALRAALQARPAPDAVANLLAVLCRDGGQFLDEHGLEAACNEATKNYYEALARPAVLATLDWNRLRSGDRRALDPENQWAFDRLAAHSAASLPEGGGK